MEQEIWKDIEGFQGYKISSFGRVKSYHNNKEIIRKPNIVCGYQHVMLNKNGKKFNFYIHRLVAEVFVININNKPQVNHIDGNKLNNNYSNLEWCTQKENCQHAWKTGLCEHNRSILKTRDYSKLRQFNKLWSKAIYSVKLDKEFESVRCASRYIQEHYHLNSSTDSIKVCINDLLKGRKIDSVYNYGWSYINK